MKKILLCFFSFVLAFSFVGCKKSDNLTDLSKNLSNYTINLEIDAENKFVQANQTVDFFNNTDSILKQLKFHLYPQFFEEGNTNYILPSTRLNEAYPNGMSYANFEIERVKIDNTDIKICYEGECDNILVVNLNESLLPEKRVEIVIDYSFSIPNCEHRFGYGENTINLANFYPIACVFENNEFSTKPYNANGEPFYSDISNYCVNITVEKQYIVASSGNKTNENVENNLKNLSFQTQAVRDFALVLSDKFEIISEKVGNTNIEYFYTDDDEKEQSLQASVDSIKTFSNLFGAFPYETYSVVQSDFIYGGMEFPNLVMISNDIQNIDDYKNVIIHETAHQWWYAMVGNDEFSFPWLDEALTEYSTILFYDHNNYNLTHKEMVETCHSNYLTFITVYEDVLGSIDTSMRAVDEYSTEPEYTYCTYVKGVLMFESLNSVIGEKNFYSALKLYFENNKFKNATPEDLISAFEQTSKQELNNFFSSWINGKVVIR